MSKTLEFVQKVNADIDNGSTPVYGAQYDAEGNSDVSAATKWLLENGWKYYNSSSRCKVASSEQHLKKGNYRIEMIASNFFGKFVEITVNRG